MAFVAKSHQTGVRKIRFTEPTIALAGMTVGGTVAATVSADGKALLSLIDTLNQDDGWLDTNDLGGVDIDDLLYAEFVLKADTFNENAAVVVGMSAATNVDPDAVTAAAWFKLIGQGSGGPLIYLESDDGTTNVDDKATGIQMTLGEYHRFRLDFASGIQTISPPGKSKGGKGSIQYSVTGDRGFSQSPLLTAHLDMDAYTSWLQPLILAIDSEATPSANTDLVIEGIDIGYRRH